MLTHGTMGGQWQAVIVLVVGLTSLTLAGCQRDLVRSNDLVYSEAVEHTSDMKLLVFLDSGLVPMGRIQYGKGEHAIHDLNAFMAAEDGYSSHAMAIYHVPAPTLGFGKVFFAFKHARKFLSPVFLGVCLWCTLVYELWKKDALHVISMNTWGLLKHRHSKGRSMGGNFVHMVLFWLIFLGGISSTDAVTCHSCFDGITGCAGGAACLFSTRTAANLAALTVAGGAAINVVSLLPASYTRHLPAQVLRTLTAIARIPDNAGPPDVGAMTLTELQECYTNGRIDISAYRGELGERLGDPGTAAAMVTRIGALLQAIQGTSVTPTSRTIGGMNSYGALGYLVAVASLIVNSGKRTYSAGSSTEGSVHSAPSTHTLSIRVPTCGSMFAELLMVWQTLAHAVGAANILATAPFLQQIVWDGISTLGLIWDEAYCLFLIYLEAIEESQGSLHLGNVFSAGAQDTRLKAAMQRHKELFDTCAECDPEKDKGTKETVWNDKCSPNARKICKSYNFKDAKHPAQHLYNDGTCKFRHVCNKWVTGKGPGGMCEQNHPAWACTNPDRTNTKPTS